MVAMGWHIESFFKMIFIESRRPDFIEMSLHHCVTIYLVGGSYLNNIWEIGATILFIHDIADIFVALIRGSSETKVLPLKIMGGVTCLSSWIYTRILVFPWVIYTLYHTELQIGSRLIMPFWITGLSSLFLLHLWWLKLLLTVLFNFAKTGKTEDY